MIKEVRTIGNATIYLGDSLEIMRGMPDKSINMIFTDPPYGHNNNNGDLIHNREKALGKSKGKEAEARPIANDGAEANEIFKNALPEFNRLLDSGCCCCCCGGGGGPDPQFARWSLWMDEVFNFKQMVVWDKGKIGMGWHYRRSYETVLVADKKGSKPKWFATAKNIENIIRPGDYGIKKIIPKKTDHPTPKPIELPTHFIGLHSQPGDVVFDPFMGAGSTGVAAIKSGRKFVGIEIDPHWFEVACKRLEAA
ncbi:MAG: site-specific DNA-methyltransferase [Methylobacter sp.]|uniref:DNA-methyltransferase n=1 Tax=Methylobacter sp. TaxID=2051955 RepID=UPI0025D8439E|nr:site-specific DNA-methyltransferase [Methylobacter sp.]MCK9622145.1 site-specific DNA-methyltransferase [Methylobacter sp.]